MSRLCWDISARQDDWCYSIDDTPAVHTIEATVVTIG